MLTYPLTIQEISHETFKGDAILYIYVNNELKDALTLTQESKRPPTAYLEFSLDSSIQITSKDLNKGINLGTCSFTCDLLLNNPDSLILPLDSKSVISKVDSYPRPWIKLSLAANEKSFNSPKIRENIRDQDIFRAIQSELDLEKWKNTGLKQIREEMNSSELARVSIMQKLTKTVEKYEQEISELRNLIGKKALVARTSAESLRIMEGELKASREIWANREKNYETRIEMLRGENLKRSFEIKRMKEENFKTLKELDEVKSADKETGFIDLDLKHQKDQLEYTLKSLTQDVSLNRSNLNEAVDQIISFQTNNTKLRAYIAELEDKADNAVKDLNFDIMSLINTHLDALSIQAQVVQVTKNIFKIDNDSLYIYLENGELMTRIGTENITFVEWLQKNKWLCDGEEQATFEKPKRLDTVPEEEVEDETLISPVVFKKKEVKKSPIKQIKEFSPILKKKSGR